MRTRASYKPSWLPACGVRPKDVSWAGLKDRHAVTEQWLSVHLPKGEPDFSAFSRACCKHWDLGDSASQQKVASRRFNWQPIWADFVWSGLRWCGKAPFEKVAQVGVPSASVLSASVMKVTTYLKLVVEGRENVRTRNQNKRSLYLSAARSWIYNLILSDRIEQDAFASATGGRYRR